METPEKLQFEPLLLASLYPQSGFQLSVGHYFMAVDMGDVSSWFGSLCPFCCLLSSPLPCPFSGVNLELPKEALFSIPFSAKMFLVVVVLRQDLSM